MSGDFFNLTLDTLPGEHLCCAMSDKKHQHGVAMKKEWLAERIPEGHVFRKLDEKGKVFIEYAKLEKAWVPVVGDNYLFVYCLWVSGSFKGKGYAGSLLNYCIDDASEENMSGVCVISSKKKRPFLSEKTFFEKYGFKTVDTIGDFELLALSLDGTVPRFSDTARSNSVDQKGLTIYHTKQCPFIMNCIEEISGYCKEKNICLNIIEVDTLEKAKSIPCVFNNWAIFRDGKFLTTQLMNAKSLDKLLMK